MKWLRRLAGGLFVGILAVALVLGMYAQQVLPQIDGTVTLTGPGAQVRIERDAEGVPTIKAASLQDVLFGLGFVHAQDRLWQLEVNRRVGAGRLAEAFGETALPTDKFLRALGVRRSAAVQWAQAGPQAREAVLSYSAGINAYIKDQMRARPPEFLALGIQPETWDPVDSTSWAIMMAWDLGGNYSTELLRMRLALKLPVERINELLPPYPGEKPLATADYAALYRDLKVDGALGQQALLAAPLSSTEGLGSNNWVVSGEHSESGQPLLANDPHLRLGAPALWYVARLEAPGLKVAGATLPGLPLVILGQNEQVAWGFTNTGPDVQDLYLERIKPDDPDQYQTPEGWARFETSQEIIRVKGRPDVLMTVRATRHGPVISDAGGSTEGLTGPRSAPSYALAFRWTALDSVATNFDAAVGMNKARSVAEFFDAAAQYVAPMQNMVVADRQGHIGLVAAGRVPVRKPENDLKGLVPAPGWDARYDWAGVLDAKLTPREMDPARGYIATANQRIHPPDYPHYLTNEWAPPYREQRIEQLLQARPRHSLDSLRDIQADVLSLAAQRLLPFLKNAPSKHPLADAARQELSSFDGTMAVDRAAPLIFWAWVRHLAKLVFADELGPTLAERAFAARSFREALERVMEQSDGWWCDDKTTAAAETCEQRSAEALTRALDELRSRFGENVAAWRWGAAHVARSEHRPFSHVKLLARWFELRVPVGGDSYTVNVSRVSLSPDPRTGELYFCDHAPSLRALYDVGDPTHSRFMYSSGQSGIVFSGLYRNFVKPWARVEYLPLWTAPPAHTLLLEPLP